MRVDKQYILSEIRRTAQQNGGLPLGRQRFSRETGIKVTEWSGKYWARWGDALRDAGFAPNQFATAYEREMLIGKLVSLIREMGRFPVEAEIRMRARTDSAFPSHNAFRTLGSTQGRIEAVLEFCKARSGYEDVTEICLPIVADSLRERETPDEDNVIGFVYLVRSGRYYKIGRSNSAGRREYELAIQMPDEVKMIHRIRTDDPVGIEAYWHQRFGQKRKNGEWFELSSADVNTFKRRKFM